MAASDDSERIARRLARAGIASRREAERMIAAGRVRVNGKPIDSPALNVGPRDRVEVDGKPLAAPEPARLWLYHKPLGLVTTERDEKGRATVFSRLPEGMPRVVSVGRLDINSEGLLLLTNDGALKRRLELPSTGWLRKYRVRVNGTPDEVRLDDLRRGIELDGERFQPMQVTLDRQQGANAWLTVGIREGRNREVRRAMEAVGLTVNRLIRVSYGPFQLGRLEPGAVEEVRARVLRDQLGLGPDPTEVGAGHSGPRAGAGARRKPGPGKGPAGKAVQGEGQGAEAGAGGRFGGPAHGSAPGGSGPRAKPASKPAADPGASLRTRPAAQPNAKDRPRAGGTARKGPAPSASRPARGPGTEARVKPALAKPRPGRPPRGGGKGPPPRR